MRNEEFLMTQIDLSPNQLRKYVDPDYPIELKEDIERNGLIHHFAGNLRPVSAERCLFLNFYAAL